MNRLFSLILVLGALCGCQCGPVAPQLLDAGELTSGEDGGSTEWDGGIDAGLDLDAGFAPDAGRDDGGTTRTGACLDAGFCWQYPLPQGNDLLGVYSPGNGQVWTVGPKTLLHWNGPTATLHPEGELPLRVLDTWGTSAQDVWAVGYAHVMHWDGSTWKVSEFPNRTFNAIAGSSAQDVWAVGSYRSLMHFDGSTWTEFPSPTIRPLHDVWVGGPTVAWAVGDSGTILRFDGTSWTEVSSGVNDTLRGVWGSGPNDVYIVGHGSRVLHWDGVAVTPLAPRPQGGLLTSVTGSGPKDVWTSGWDGQLCHYNGQSWDGCTRHTEQNLQALWAVSATEVYAAGDLGVLLRFDGTTWNHLSEEVYGTVTGLWEAPNQRRWAVTDKGHVLRQDAGGWTREYTAPSSTIGPVLNGLWGLNQERWAVGSSGLLLHFDGTHWNSQAGVSYSRMLDVWGASPTEVWAVGFSGVVVKWDGTGWTRISVPTTEDLYSVHGTSPQDVWAVGDRVVLHYDGQGWSVNPSPSARFKAVFAVSSSEVWAAGSGSSLYRWNGTAWTWELIPGFSVLYQVNDLHGDATSLYVLGSVGELARRQGGQWVVVQDSIFGPFTGRHERVRVWADGVYLAGPGILRRAP